MTGGYTISVTSTTSWTSMLDQRTLGAFTVTKNGEQTTTGKCPEGLVCSTKGEVAKYSDLACNVMCVCSWPGTYDADLNNFFTCSNGVTGLCNEGGLCTDVKPFVFGRAKCNAVKSTTGEWTPVGTGSYEITQGTSWDASEEASTTQSVTDSLGAEAGVGFGPVSMSVSASHEVSSEASSTVSKSQGGSLDTTCAAPDCDNGLVYQWAMATMMGGGRALSITSCFFTCVPMTVHSPPKCPNGYCASSACQCCNAVWDAADDPGAPAYLMKGAFASDGTEGTCIVDSKEEKKEKPSAVVRAKAHKDVATSHPSTRNATHAVVAARHFSSKASRDRAIGLGLRRVQARKRG
jgi:hypothetical protein